MALTAGAFGGGVFIADTSAWWRADREPVRAEWDDALDHDQLSTCPIVVMELLYSARSTREVDALGDGLAALRDVPITRSVTNSAVAALRALAEPGGGRQRRIRVPDLLIAAAAQDVGIGVLHYDADFDVLATVLSFESRWIAPPGSLA